MDAQSRVGVLAQVTPEAVIALVVPSAAELFLDRTIALVEVELVDEPDAVEQNAILAAETHDLLTDLLCEV